MIPREGAQRAIEDHARARGAAPPAGTVIVTGNAAAILWDAWRILQQIEERERAARPVQPVREGVP